jgi:branched-chain amino acid transport system ATP-binding protein
MAEILKLQNVSSYYGQICALDDVSIQVQEKKIVTLIGANGAGKSTLLKTVCHLVEAKKGKIIYGGRDITNKKTETLAGLGISLVPEGREIFTDLTVKENLLLGATCHLRKASKQEIGERFQSIYEIFPRLTERKNQLGGTLSGGEQQMLAMGRGLMSKPSLLLLDEPSMGLAPHFVKEIFRVIKKLNEGGTTILLVEQNVKSALEVADKGYVLQNRKVALEGAASELAQNRDIRKMYLGEEK